MNTTGIRDTAFLIKMISEGSIHIQKDTNFYFIDFEKSFDKVRHKDIFELVGKQFVEMMYDLVKMSCLMRENLLCSYTKMERGLRQGYVFSSELFNLYIRANLNELETLSGFINDKCNNYIMRYVLLIAVSERKLQYLHENLTKHSK